MFACQNPPTALVHPISCVAGDLVLQAYIPHEPAPPPPPPPPQDTASCYQEAPVVYKSAFSSWSPDPRPSPVVPPRLSSTTLFLASRPWPFFTHNIHRKQDLSEVERALATCVPPPPPGTVPPLSPPVAPGIASNSRGAAGVTTEMGAAAASSSSQQTAQNGWHGDGGGMKAAAVIGSGEEQSSSTERGGGKADGDALQDGRFTAAGTPTPPPPPPPPLNPYVGTEAQGGSADYMDFVRVRGLVSRKAATCFKPRTFLRFPRDIRGRIPSRTFFKHVYESVTLQKTRLTLQ